jgi:hypothetical protein
MVYLGNLSIIFIGKRSKTMTVTNPSSITPTYVGDGATTTYPYTFRIYAAADMQVIRTDLLGVQELLTLSTHYTLTGVGSAGGGNIVLNTPLPTDYLLVGRCVLSVVQQADLRNQGAFYPEVLEDAFDKIIKICQQLQEQANRALAVATVPAMQAMLDAAGALYDLFDDRFLGPKSSDPSLDNDGNALATGTIYFNTSSNSMKVYSGSVWGPVALPSVLYRSGAQTLINGTTTETTVATFDVPGGTLGTDKAVRFTLLGNISNTTGSNNDITIRMYYGSAVVGSLIYTHSSDGYFYVATVTGLLMNKNGATNDQTGRLHLSLARDNVNANPIERESGDATTLTQDSTQTKTLKITVQHSNGASGANSIWKYRVLEGLL